MWVLLSIADMKRYIQQKHSDILTLINSAILVHFLSPLLWTCIYNEKKNNDRHLSKEQSFFQRTTSLWLPWRPPDQDEQSDSLLKEPLQWWNWQRVIFTCDLGINGLPKKHELRSLPEAQKKTYYWTWRLWLKKEEKILFQQFWDKVVILWIY